MPEGLCSTSKGLQVEEDINVCCPTPGVRKRTIEPKIQGLQLKPQRREEINHYAAGH